MVAGLGAVTLVTAVSLVVGHAASLGTSSPSLGSGRATVGSCDSGGVGIVQNLSGSNVVSVTVSQIDAGCATASISVTVDNGSANSSGSGTVPAGGGSVTVTLGSAVAAKDGEEIDVSVNGP
jgi:hypothetical protein